MSEVEVALQRPHEGDRPRSPTGRLRRAYANRETRHLIKYGIVGVTNVTVDFTLYAALVWLGLWYPVAKTASLVVATANGYTLNRLWTFRAGPHRNVMLTKYVMVVASCWAANIVMLILLVEVAGLHKITAQLIAIPVIAPASFMAQRIWTFGDVLR